MFFYAAEGPTLFSGLFGSYQDSTLHCSPENFSVGESPPAVSKNQTQTWTQNAYCKCM